MGSGMAEPCYVRIVRSEYVRPGCCGSVSVCGVPTATPQVSGSLRTFLGMITSYKDIWRRRSHILASFTALSGLPKKAKIEWTNKLDLAFKKVKAIIVQDGLMTFANHNKYFDDNTSSSDYQICACIMQY